MVLLGELDGAGRLGMNMHRVEIRVSGSDLVARMNDMREWLDSRRIAPQAFRYQHDGDEVVIRVDFAEATDASAMASRFGGHIVR
jgi:hypothetical protein